MWYRIYLVYRTEEKTLTYRQFDDMDDLDELCEKIAIDNWRDTSLLRVDYEETDRPPDEWLNEEINNSVREREKITDYIYLLENEYNRTG